MHQLDADTWIQERAARGSREKFDRVQAKVPDFEPEVSPPWRGAP